MDRLARVVGNAGMGVFGLGLLSEFCLYDVDAGSRAVIFDKFRGVLPATVGEGTHFRIPFVQEAVIMDIKSRPRVIHSSTGTKDLQMVNISLRVLSRPKEEALPKILQTLGADFDDRVLPSLGNEVLKGVVAQYNAEELLSKRADVSGQIKEGG
jgi:prohibitin 1